MTGSRVRCHQVAATLLEWAEQDGTRGTGVAMRIANNFETMRVKFAPRLGFLHTVSCFSNPYAGTSEPLLS